MSTGPQAPVVLRGLLREAGLAIYLTSDVLPVTAAVESAIGGDRGKLENFYRELVDGLLRDFPQISGLVLRIGESDGVDVKDPIRTRLHVRSAQDTNRLLRILLPVFEARERTLILRTWTVGAHRIGDLIWHRGTLAAALSVKMMERMAATALLLDTLAPA